MFDKRNMTITRHSSASSPGRLAGPAAGAAWSHAQHGRRARPPGHRHHHSAATPPPSQTRSYFYTLPAHPDSGLIHENLAIWDVST